MQVRVLPWVQFLLSKLSIMELNVDKSDKKYWYRTDVYSCVLCGKEKKFKVRVHSIEEQGTFWKDDACPEHFI